VSASDGGRENLVIRKRPTDAGMCMKTKYRCGKQGAKAGMSMKIKVVIGLKPECY
jgi:hypothetical protein